MNEVNFCLSNVAILIFWFLRLCLTNAGGGEHCSSQGLGIFKQREIDSPRIVYEEPQGHEERRRVMDEGNNNVFYCGGCSHCYPYVCCSIYRSRW